MYGDIHGSFLIGSWTDFVTELTMSIIGNNSLQHAEKAMILASIVDRAVSVSNLDCQKTGQYAKIDDKSNPTFGTGRICMFLMTIHNSKICIRIGINLAHIA
jgi:hypothetical protein